MAEHDFDLALLARPDGDRRLANVRKLIRLAREYEQLRGPDLEGFVRFCEEQADLAAREGEAAIADEGGDAVVLMTVHSAKGLEFDVVVRGRCRPRLGGRRRAGRAGRPPTGGSAFRAVPGHRHHPSRRSGLRSSATTRSEPSARRGGAASTSR